MPLHAKYESNLAAAKEFEAFASDTLAHRLAILPVVFRSRHYQVTYGESLTGVEFKLDNNFRQYGNLYVEIAETYHAGVQKKPAGIYHKSAPWLFVIGDNLEFWMFCTRCLVIEHQSGAHRVASGATSDGFLLPVTRADEIRAWKWPDNV